MTWVEILILVSLAGAIGGFTRRRTPTGKLIMLLSAFVLGVLLAVFGPELVGDFL